MKKILLTSLMSVGALGAHAQGQLVFTDYIYGGAHPITTHIWSPSSTSPGVAQSGNTASDVPAGSTTYANSTLLGGFAVNGSGANPTYQNGNNWTVQLEALGGATTAVPLSSLLPVTQYTTHLNTSGGAAAAGEWQTLSVANDPGVPGAVNGTSGTGPADYAVACWYNGGGTITTLAAASASTSGIWGESAEVVNAQLTEPSSVTGGAPGIPNPETANSFRLTSVPEPSSIALGVMAASAFLARRRKS